jgi:hypothetical protein
VHTEFCQVTIHWRVQSPWYCYSNGQSLVNGYPAAVNMHLHPTKSVINTLLLFWIVVLPSSDSDAYIFIVVMIRVSRFSDVEKGPL